MAKHDAPRPSVKRKAVQEAKRQKAPLLAMIALVGLFAVGGTIAWITDTDDPVVNTFQPSEVTCEVVESGGTNSDDFIDGESTIKTNVKVRNTGDTDAYIRAAVVANWVKVDSANNSEVLGTAPVLDTDTNEGDYSLILSDGWILGADGYYYCKTKVPANAGNESLTPVLFTQCRQLKTAPVEGYVLSLDILCSAIQAEPDKAVESWSNGNVTVKASGGGLSVTPAVGSSI